MCTFRTFKSYSNFKLLHYAMKTTGILFKSSLILLSFFNIYPWAPLSHKGMLNCQINGVGWDDIKLNFFSNNFFSLFLNYYYMHWCHEIIKFTYIVTDLNDPFFLSSCIAFISKCISVSLKLFHKMSSWLSKR